MKTSVALTPFLLVLTVIGCGCIGMTDYTYTGGTTQYYTDSASGAKFVCGDIIQPDISDEWPYPNVAVMIVGITGDIYHYKAVTRESASGPWIASPNEGTPREFWVIEETFPNKIGHVDPDSLAILSSPSATPTVVVGPGKLQILTHELEREGYGSTYGFETIYVVGTAKNVGGSRISWATVEAKFYDHDGNVIGNSLDYIQDLDPGETWKFKIMYYDLDGGVTSYKLEVSESLLI